MNLANRNCDRSSAILTIFRGTEVQGPHLHDQDQRSLQNSMQVLATFYMPIEHMILNGIVHGCGPHIGHLLESNLSRHNLSFISMDRFKKVLFIAIVLYI
jgi:hypothetical protein